MARPKKGSELGATQSIGVRVSEELRLKMEALARQNGWSITDEARLAFEAHVARAGRKSKRGRA